MVGVVILWLFWCVLSQENLETQRASAVSPEPSVAGMWLLILSFHAILSETKAYLQTELKHDCILIYAL